MKKSILNLGKALSKANQKLINGGNGTASQGDCMISDPTDPWGAPILVGHAPCDGVSMCPGYPGFLGGLPYPPLCYSL
ncbi:MULTISPECIES: hypothetical protein [unclassified Tenacibaculum]|uniref:hypothetical protein n=1 Tax=unclassified Tenacibaculum TaxID=2635139 RepID=UPI001F261A73|nr:MULTISPECIES: hypothetical protein [unclassified Tenacibaculum]MCF2875522.1 hypothetical protein [Tenacibaculum sp. Cn5-1]MCF2935598.1 hypothetical protein [Tenacibaculum sp. Cn5-34]MCG7512158.1 hypothetical protein [Tenacibaculum sp. Cn5-46]